MGSEKSEIRAALAYRESFRPGKSGSRISTPYGIAYPKISEIRPAVPEYWLPGPPAGPAERISPIAEAILHVLPRLLDVRYCTVDAQTFTAAISRSCTGSTSTAGELAMKKCVFLLGAL